MKQSTTKELQSALEKTTGRECMYGKGGFWIKGQGHVTMSKARRMTGIAAPRRNTQRVSAWGDYATIAMMNSGRSK